jgi:phospholipase/carboxylesterase
MKSLSGPRREPASGGEPAELVVLLHGVGADGNDLIALAPAVASSLPGARFVAPNAPEPYDMAPFGHQWFSLRDFDPGRMAAGASAAAPLLDRFIDDELAAAGLTDEDLAIVGFSQGTMMALHVALRRKRPPAAVVGFSGALLAPDRLASEITVRPPVLLIHGEADPVVPAQALQRAMTTLEAAGVPVRGVVRPGLGHGIDPEGLGAALAFLTDSFAAARARSKPDR